MAKTEALTNADTAAVSAEFTVSAGTPVTVGMKGQTTANATIAIQIKDFDGNWQQLSGGYLTPADPVKIIDGAGVYRLSRPVGKICGAWYE